MSKRDRRGQGVMEYGLILVLIGIAAMATSEATASGRAEAG